MQLPDLRRSLQVIAAAVLLALSAAPAMAQQAALVGVLGIKALLVVDGAAPRALGAGEALNGVRVLSVGKDSADIEANGTRLTLHLGDTPVHVGSAASTAATGRLVLRADSRGHFVNSGLINGKVMQYMIDTGATTIAISQNEAKRMGIDYERGTPIQVSTGNGIANGWRVTLRTVRVGEIEVHNMESVILPQPMPYVLLGNNFLSAFQMTRTNDEMILQRK
ncbi:TIGR02281 family clan AA aspartic protease [Diaphorobacter sp.]|uniref:retropepsin-like aspartic protease family protein n=1 Tax=Diaphorobacter sp. TaxID=1934310 RepID=UPI0028AB29A7|nr:TIGR02281 family clan AA aspartic protease [Diaphorobacter sp.]